MITLDKASIQSLAVFAVQTNLKFDKLSHVIHGNYGGYNVAINPNTNKTLTISVAVKCNESAPLLPEMRAITALNKKFLGVCNVSRYRVDFTVKAATGAGLKATVTKKLFPALEFVTSQLRERGYKNCCQNCGADEGVGTYYAYNAPALFCAPCADAETARNDDIMRERNAKRENIVGGIIGALLGSLLGAAAIILIDQLGYVASISGVIMGVCALKGYEMLGGKLTKRGIIISTVIMFLMVFLSNQINWAIALTKEAADYGFFDCFKLVNFFLFTGRLPIGDYLPGIIMLYLFTALGAVPTITNTLKQQSSTAAFYRIDVAAEEPARAATLNSEPIE